MASIQCFLVHPTTKYRVTLRRYSRTTKCPANNWCHNADVFIGEEDHPGEQPVSGDVHPRDDERWPTTCAECGYTFQEEDYHQKNYNLVYCTAEGTEYTLVSSDQVTSDKGHGAPPGAMWECSWMGSKGPDGKSYCVRTPGGDWHIDGQYGTPNPGRWNRTGEAPNFTVNPSIGIGVGPNGQGWAYHGWLRSGLLVDA